MSLRNVVFNGNLEKADIEYFCRLLANNSGVRNYHIRGPRFEESPRIWAVQSVEGTEFEVSITKKEYDKKEISRFWPRAKKTHLQIKYLRTEIPYNLVTHLKRLIGDRKTDTLKSITPYWMRMSA